MSVFLDTSALLAVIDADDDFHTAAREQWETLLDEGEDLLTTNYTLLETGAILQRRVGIEAVRVLVADVQPILDIVWISHEVHELAAATLLAANRRKLSLVDLTSFQIMRDRGLDTAFTFDEHFAEQGFSLVPAQ